MHVSTGGGEKREDRRAGKETPALARNCIFICLSTWKSTHHQLITEGIVVKLDLHYYITVLIWVIIKTQP